MSKMILSVDQSTQGTKALLFDERGALIARVDRPHRQIVNEKGWVEHDPEEILRNTLQAARDVVAKANADKGDIAALGISNQRETSVVWNRRSGKPVYNAIVWQCARGAEICDELERQGCGDAVRAATGIQLSPYFPAAKLAWIFRHVDGAAELARRGELCAGTVDSWLIYCLTGGQRFQTDYSNASRTQLFNLTELRWDERLLKLFGIDPSCMAEVTDSDGDFGQTDLGGWLERPIPIRSALGDSHAALFGQACLKPGMTKCTYGTGSSIMMNIGERPVFSEKGVVTSLAWKIGGRVQYVMEGNINYTGAVITWLKDDLHLIDNPAATAELAARANPFDQSYLVPAFSGLGAPYWDSKASAAIMGMSRTTGRNEVVRAALECIAYQIADVVSAMAESTDAPLRELRVDGGPTRNPYLMQFQSDLLGIPVRIPDSEELSGIGAAYAAGLAIGLYGEEVFDTLKRTGYAPAMAETQRAQKIDGWRRAVRAVQTLSRL